jgi:acetoin utilization deacetylase AcuC-like enzyme
VLTFSDAAHRLHAPKYEFFRGERVPCFETPQRLERVMRTLTERGHTVQAPTVDSTPLLTRIHTPRYIAFLASAWQQWCALHPDNAMTQPFPSVWPVRTLRSDRVPTHFIAQLGLFSMDNGTPLVAGTWAAAKAGADAAASAADAVAGGVPVAFCATRPPGHHAGADFMGGYCFLNNAAIAAQRLRDQGYARVAIIDVDYHHGNGTQSIFYERDDVLFVSVHGDPTTEYPFYLGHADERGAGAGLGFNVNFPLPAGTSAADWFSALGTACNHIRNYRPDALVVSLGLDTYEGDPISTFRLQSSDFTHVGQRLAQLGLPTVLVLEGGYATEALGLNAANVIEGFEAGCNVK